MDNIYANSVGIVKKDTYTLDEVKLIIEILKYTYEFEGLIARQFGIDVNLVSDINKGLRYRQESEEYPIRTWKSRGKVSFTYEDVTDIINLLKNTNMSFREIAKLYNVEHSQISQICYGTNKKYRRKSEKYPIRNHS